MNLFALTARGGRRNHVFLVPDNTEATRRNVEARVNQVKNVVERSSESPKIEGDLVVAWRRVLQATTGRWGCEWLCLSGIDASAMPEATRKAVEVWLEERLADLEGIVARHCWDRSEALFEVIPELADWQRKAQSEFASFQPTGARTSSPRELPRGGQRSGRRWLVAVGVTLVIVILVIMLLNDNLRPRWWHATSAHMNDAEISDQAWRRFVVDLLGQDRFPTHSNDLKKYLDNLATELGKLFYSKTSGDRSPERIVEEILLDFEKEVGRGGGGPLAQLIKSGPPQDLKQLFPRGEFDPMGLVDWPPEDENFWRGMDPYLVDKLLQPVVKDKQAWRIPHDVRQAFQAQEERNWYPVFERLEHFCENPPQSLKIVGQRKRRFYKTEDIATLTELRKLLQDLVAKVHTVSVGEGECKTAWQCLEVFVKSIDRQRQPGNDLDRLIRGYDPDIRPQTKPIVDAAKMLLQLGGEWAAILKRHAEGSTYSVVERAAGG